MKLFPPSHSPQATSALAYLNRRAVPRRATQRAARAASCLWLSHCLVPLCMACKYRHSTLVCRHRCASAPPRSTAAFIVAIYCLCAPSALASLCRALGENVWRTARRAPAAAAHSCMHAAHHRTPNAPALRNLLHGSGVLNALHGKRTRSPRRCCCNSALFQHMLACISTYHTAPPSFVPQEQVTFAHTTTTHTHGILDCCPPPRTRCLRAHLRLCALLC